MPLHHLALKVLQAHGRGERGAHGVQVRLESGGLYGGQEQGTALGQLAETQPISSPMYRLCLRRPEVRGIEVEAE